MKILDRYIAKNFLVGYVIALLVMLGMFMTIDLFLHIDEFAENSDLGARAMTMNILHYYFVHSCLWYRQLAGMVIVIAAVFSLARMTRNNELIAIMASGVSLKRILAPILFLSLLLTGLMVADQEWLIPRLSHELIQKHDEVSGEGVYDLWFIGDNKASLICSRRYEERTQTLYEPIIILREPLQNAAQVYRVVGKIQADKAVYDAARGGWRLTGGRFLRVIDPAAEPSMDASRQSAEPIDFYETALSAQDLPIRRQEGFKSLLSLQQLVELEHNSGTRRTDLAELALQKHSRITDPAINMIMLMVALPVLVCRDPRAMKTAILISFLTTGACFIVVFLCKLFATEVFLGHIQPAFWTWVPIFLFFPVAIVQIDSMRT
ncbi:MAG: LptF/LptG family permease [Planctomycetaceae bacterium]|nr:LptF/LptG family permease [Planctomycetaceae bacterium]